MYNFAADLKKTKEMAHADLLHIINIIIRLRKHGGSDETCAWLWTMDIVDGPFSLRRGKGSFVKAKKQET